MKWVSVDRSILSDSIHVNAKCGMTALIFVLGVFEEDVDSMVLLALLGVTAWGRCGRGSMTRSQVSCYSHTVILVRDQRGRETAKPHLRRISQISPNKQTGYRC